MNIIGIAILGNLGAVAHAEQADVRAQRTINAPQRQVFEYLLDLRNQPNIWPEDCATNYEVGDKPMGVGAETRLTYRVGAWKRTLDARISSALPSERIDVDHTGKKGFTTTWTIEAVGDLSKVSVDTWVSAPPRPFVRFYERRVRPGWTACHSGALDNLAKAVTQAGRSD
mgnify:CR=1 FL=1